ncbi:DUF3626 domain-containing protein [Paenibacillus sp. 1011MAR3C5]|uniref:DUF3626 domain-containing protein n=1 Tax=Paenibacillus sp. 1011MAR3C5 TaxID=1675787 RepID=UPI000E6D1A54|nr:DUF3626 domain-containing protein [Paenibacillus sp. 1011MAR3C5]RJE86938.1 DUF3626 domain-containing protein [Paenibacillus sp. 1011MAR3C5]
MSHCLTPAQQLAIDHIAAYAQSRKDDAASIIEEVLAMSNIHGETLEQAVASMNQHARVALHFHPDRLNPAMKSIAEALLEEGVYKSQFETFLSNGSVSAYPGGQRDVWEERLFGGAYQTEGTTNAERPKYGALNLMLHPDGPAPRFGSCYFLLRPNVTRRCTFTYMDSHQEPEEKGTSAQFSMILAALLRDAFQNESALGERELTPGKLLEHLIHKLGLPLIEPSHRLAMRNLNHYIEAQIHGTVSLKEDAESLVADPSFKGTKTGELLERLCLLYDIRLFWHMGYSLAVADVPSNFRGPAMPSLAQRIAVNGRINAHTIGAAAAEVVRHPDAWSDRGSAKAMLQELKLLWHVLVRYGSPFPI